MRVLALGVLTAAALLGQAPFDRIVNAAKDPGNWLTYSGNYLGHRFSPLTQITPSNVRDLRVKWAYQFSTPGNEVSPIIADSVMYVTGPQHRGGARSAHRPRAVDLEAAHSIRLPIHRFWTRQPRPGHSG